MKRAHSQTDSEVLPGVLPIVLSKLKGNRENMEIWIDSICVSSLNTHHGSCCQGGVFWIQTALAITTFYSKQDSMELVWVAASLNMSYRDKRVCQCEFVHLCVYMCVCARACIVCIQYNNSSPNMKGAAHWIWRPTLQQHQHSVTKEETGRPRPPNKQAGAEQLRLLTAKMIQSEFWVKRKTCHRGSMTTIWKIVQFGLEDQVCLIEFHFFWLMSPCRPQRSDTAQTAAAFQFQSRRNWVCVFHEAAAAIN